MDTASEWIMYLVGAQLLGAMAWLAYRTASRSPRTAFGANVLGGIARLLAASPLLLGSIALINLELAFYMPGKDKGGEPTSDYLMVAVGCVFLGALARLASRWAAAQSRIFLDARPRPTFTQLPDLAPPLPQLDHAAALQTRTSSEPAPMAVPAALPIRETMVGRKYELDHRIGEGGMGLVFAGRDLELGRFVAIKKMRPELKLNARDKKRFMQEATLSAALHHPCIVEIYDIAEQNGEVYLIFEFVDGQTMDKRLDEGPMTAAELKPFLKYVCQALQFAHSKKVVHRDLKPSNIMLTRQGFAKVVDFGIAREIKDAASRLTNMDTSGTLAYMAPEQELGRFDARSDIYSLGATLYEALCAQHPFPGPNYLLQKEKHSFTPLAEAAPEAPREFRDAIERCLRYDPKDRYQSVAEFARDAGVA